MSAPLNWLEISMTLNALQFVALVAVSYFGKRALDWAEKRLRFYQHYLAARAFMDRWRRGLSGTPPACGKN